MGGQSTADEVNRANIHAFRYPDAPWEPDAGPSVGLFREIGPEETSPAANSESELPNLAGLALPVRYEYRLEPGFDLDWEDPAVAEDEQTGTSQESSVGATAPETETDRYFRELLAGECAKATERGRAEGLELGRTQGRQEGSEEAIRQLHAGVEGERNRLAEQTAALLKSFAEARDGYIHRLERESTRLALAIAARILRREAQADPLLLTGAVRVALGQLSATTAVRLRVPAPDLALWTEALAHIPNLAIRPEVIGDPRLKLGDCSMETELGSADLALDSQLEVLERGFFEREEARSEASPDNSANPDLPGGTAYER
jgi:flagellar biosynthesis/type III secretory pathway protein FliH